MLASSSGVTGAIGYGIATPPSMSGNWLAILLIRKLSSGCPGVTSRSGIEYSGWFAFHCAGDTSSFKFFNRTNEVCQATVGYKTDALGQIITVTDPATRQPTPVPILAAQPVTGFRLQDARASYGIGLETFALGFPIHFDWSWRTTFNKDWESVIFSCTDVAANGSCISGAADFRKPRFAVWIGYDF